MKFSVEEQIVNIVNDFESHMVSSVFTQTLLKQFSSVECIDQKKFTPEDSSIKKNRNGTFLQHFYDYLD